MNEDESAQDDPFTDEDDLVLLRSASITHGMGLSMAVDGDVGVGPFVALRLGGLLNHTGEVREQAYVFKDAAQLGVTVEGLVEIGVATYGPEWAHILAGALVEFLDVE